MISQSVAVAPAIKLTTGIKNSGRNFGKKATAKQQRGIEIAPTKVWPDPPAATDDEVDAYRRFWNERFNSLDKYLDKIQNKKKSK